MTDAVDALTDDQARNAAKLLFDLLPATAWEGGRKPSEERVRTLVGGLRDDAPTETQRLLDALLAADRPERSAAQAGIARIVLRQAMRSPPLAGPAAQATALAAKPDMAFDPVTGIFVIGLLLATTRIEKTEAGFKVELGGTAKDILSALRLPELLHELPAVLAALPAEILARIKG